MREKLFFYSLVMFVALLAASCGQSNNAMRVVPKDAVMVVKMNVGQLLEKSEAKDIKQLKELESQIPDAAAKEIFQQVMADPSCAGVDLMQPVVLAITDFKNPGGVFAASISSKDDFAKLLEKMQKVEGVTFNLSTGDVCTASVEGREIVAFDDEVLVISGNEKGIGLKPSNLLKQAADDSFLKAKNAEEFLSCNDDYAVFVDFNRIISSLPDMRDVDQLMKMYGSMLDGMAVFASLNFEDGQAVAKYSVYGNDEYMAAVKNTMQDADGTFLKMAPANSYFVAQMGVNDMATSLKCVDKSIIDKVNSRANIDLAKLLASMHGDIMVSVAPQAGSQYPYFVCAMECKDDALWNTMRKFLDEVHNSTIKPTGDGYDFIMKDELGYDLHLGYKDNAITIAPKGAYLSGDDFTKSEYAGVLKDNGMVLNLAELMKMPSLKDTPAASMLPMFSFAKAVTCTSTATSGEVKLITEKGKNSLALIIDASIKAAEEYNKAEHHTRARGLPERSQ